MSSNNIIFEKLKRITLSNSHLEKLNLPKSIKLWRQGDFELLAASIAQVLQDSSLLSEDDKRELGINISVSTLERIFKHGYTIPVSIDARRLKTLNKLCIYNGYIDWLAFAAQYIDEVKAEENADIIDCVSQALTAEFAAYKRLPNVENDELLKYFVQDGPAYKRIFHILNLHVQKKWVINNALNPSHYELLESKVIRYGEQEAEVHTREYWYLRWYAMELNDYPFIYDELNNQFYLLEKHNGVWKVKINHYKSEKK